jgi:hypothetical protein
VYGIEIYANTSKAALDKLIKANNKILRILLNTNFDTPNIDLYRLFNVLPIPLLHEMSFVKLIFKFYNCKHLLPEVYQRYYVSNSSVHNHLTRNKLNLHFTTVSTNYGKRCSEFRAAQFWNNLPNDLKLVSSYSLFMKNTQQFLLNRC